MPTDDEAQQLREHDPDRLRQVERWLMVGFMIPGTSRKKANNQVSLESGIKMEKHFEKTSTGSRMQGNLSIIMKKVPLMTALCSMQPSADSPKSCGCGRLVLPLAQLTRCPQRIRALRLAAQAEMLHDNLQVPTVRWGSF